MKTYPMSRRGALKVVGALMLSGAAGQLLLTSRAKAALASASPQLNAFMAVSATLTGKPQLNVLLGQALHPALQKAVPDFDATLAKLQALLAQGDDLSADHKAEQALSQAILQGWYLGVVGKGKKAVCVTYVDALSNLAVADVLVPPSYSYGPCGTWSAKP
ncbi:sorbitol dehydrogenase family protein [Duganella sp. sic0402]|uniref:sorbitol dehydrogenase family protein n=1 Tax=Duganella sp. sic0402 TaxID=2854786 RepID=UPI001C4696F6|nr:sorbitol dehydrogenase family protein [Duganella sp. sic0402]MBV7536548.1 sorbitol dehydrogenase family protein [Duganella sp. sic0402]